GGYGYAATHLATIRHRTQELKATRLLYIVGLPQRQHLEMIFEVAAEAGWLSPPAPAEPIGFGSVVSADGKLLRSRAGDAVKLVSLLDEAVTRATALVAEKNPDLDQATRAEVAQAVGIGAVKYADLSTDRAKDYQFDFDRMLSFEGNTAPYLQYAHTRIQSIFRRPGGEPPRDGQPDKVGERAERTLVVHLLGFTDNVDEVAETLEFPRLPGYLYDLAGKFTPFYENCPVLRAPEPTLRSRLVLCDLTARVLATGLDLLGIAAPDRM